VPIEDSIYTDVKPVREAFGKEANYVDVISK